MAEWYCGPKIGWEDLKVSAQKQASVTGLKQHVHRHPFGEACVATVFGSNPETQEEYVAREGCVDIEANPNWPPDFHKMTDRGSI